MKKALVLIMGIISLPVLAGVNDDIARCSAIESDSDRLDCYDTVASYYKKQRNEKLVKPTTSLPSKASPLPPQEAKIAGKEVTQTQSPRALSGEDAFGKSVAEISQMESLESRIIGEFKGWKKGAVLTLENGQKWKVMNSRSGYVKLDNPKVTISRGVFGSFDMEIEGLNAKGKVKRID
ncbi:hypothetical protein [Aliikangiella sp. G2MR2-5]|uniref:hypothetical protein n=1 Tax=Aliikangiella sp. G2MR2-5 TaxID=2788943 RepID=UPI0018AC4810|nr:hypothetical protein [Aliikangiella sp. G2MR2-5]